MAAIRLKADTNQSDGGWIDESISKALDISIPTTHAGTTVIRRARHRSSTRLGQLPAIKSLVNWMENKKHNESAIACSQPPVGLARWTLRLLADRMVELEYVESISHETVRQVLKKTND